MDKTININLGGTLFIIDEDAYRILRDYLNAIDHKFRDLPGGGETIEDIEARIAEIFLSQNAPAGVISAANVESMISIIGKPEDFDSTGAEPPKHENVSSRSRKMFRNPDDKIIAGVCGGIATYLNTDPVWIRILFVIFTFFFLIGLFVYLALWIAVPLADSENRKKEMYGTNHFHKDPTGGIEYPYRTESRLGNAFNAIFRALGKAGFIIIRIFLIAFGVCFVIGGFLALTAFVMVFIFKYPGAFSTDITGINISYFPDLLNYLFVPSMVPWVKALIIIVVSIPLLAIIYGGIRLIFWFRVRDGFVWLGGFVIWAVSAAALSIILFNEGIGFAETGKISTKEYFKSVPDTLFIRSGLKIQDIKIDKEITIPGEESDVFYISDEKKEIYFRTRLNIQESEDKTASYEIRRRSSGRSTLDAKRKCERLIYNTIVKGKSLYLDEFFTIPAGTKWSFDFVSVMVNVPRGTIVYLDKTAEGLYFGQDTEFSKDGEKAYWRMTEDGLSLIEDPSSKK